MPKIDMYRSTKRRRAYRKHTRALAGDQCDFCAISPGYEQFVDETASFKIIRNIFPYDVWDAQTVTDHLMIVPKTHTDTLATLSPREAQEFVRLISDYEQQGYNVYARAPQSAAKSVAHQHTHLIQTSGKLMRVWIGVGGPEIRLAF